MEILKERSSNGLSKSWIYNARKLILQEDDLTQAPSGGEGKKSCFHTYGELLLSHKVCLLSVSDIALKKKLIDEIHEKKLTIKQLRERLKDLNATGGNGSEEKSLLQLIGKPKELFDRDGADEYLHHELEKARPSSLDKIKTKALERIDKIENKMSALKEKAQSMETHMQKYKDLVTDIDEMTTKKDSPHKINPVEPSN